MDERGNITIRDTSTGQVQRTVTVNVDLYPSLQSPWVSPQLAAVRADGKIVALTGPQTVKLIDVDTSKVRDLPGGSASAVGFTDGQLIILRTNETVEVWDANGADLIRTIPEGGGYERGFASSSDGELMAQLRTDGTAVITNLSSGDGLGTIQIPDNTDSRYTTMVFIPAKHELITATAGGRTTWWNLAADAWLRNACTTAGRDLTNDEWRRFIGTKPPDKLICRQ